MSPEAESLESILRLDSESQLSEQECNDAFRAQVTKWSPAITWQKLLAAAINNFRSHTAFCETRHLKTHTIDIHC